MNFKTVREIIDQKNAAGFPETLAMVGVIEEFKGEGINEKTSKPYKKVSIKDDLGELHNVTLRGTLPDVGLAGQRAQFSLSSYNGTYDKKSYIGYSGFWNDKVDVQQPTQAEQAVSQPSGGKKAEPDWDAIAEGKCRCNVVCAAVQSRQIEVASELDCDKWVQYIIHGHNKAPQQVTIERPDQQGVTEYVAPDSFPDDEPKPTEADDIPF